MSSRLQFSSSGPMTPTLLHSFPSDTSSSSSDEEAREIVEFMEQDLLNWIDDCVKRYKSLMDTRLARTQLHTYDSSLDEYHRKVLQTLKDTFKGDSYADIVEGADSKARFEMQHLLSTAKSRLAALINKQYNDVYLKKQKIQNDSVVKKVEVFVNEAEMLYDENAEQFIFLGKSRTEVEIAHGQWAEEAIQLFDQLLEDNNFHNMEFWRNELIQRLNERLEELLDECSRRAESNTVNAKQLKPLSYAEVESSQFTIKMKKEERSPSDIPTPQRAMFKQLEAFETGGTSKNKQNNSIWKTAPPPRQAILPPVEPWQPKKPSTQPYITQPLKPQCLETSKNVQKSGTPSKQSWESVPSKPTYLAMGRQVLPPVEPWQPAKAKIAAQNVQPTMVQQSDSITHVQKPMIEAAVKLQPSDPWRPPKDPPPQDQPKPFTQPKPAFLSRQIHSKGEPRTSMQAPSVQLNRGNIIMSSINPAPQVQSIQVSQQSERKAPTTKPESVQRPLDEPIVSNLSQKETTLVAPQKLTSKQQPQQRASREATPLAAPRQRTDTTDSSSSSQLSLEDQQESRPWTHGDQKQTVLQSISKPDVQPENRPVKQQRTVTPSTIPREAVSHTTVHESVQISVKYQSEIEPIFQQPVLPKVPVTEQVKPVQPITPNHSPQAKKPDEIITHHQSVPPKVPELSSSDSEDSARKIVVMNNAARSSKPRQSARSTIALGAPQQTELQVEENHLKHLQRSDEEAHQPLTIVPLQPADIDVSTSLLNHTPEIGAKETVELRVQQDPSVPPPLPVMAPRPPMHQMVSNKSAKSLLLRKSGKRPSSKGVRHTSVITITEKTLEAGIGIFLNESSFKIGFYQPFTEHVTPETRPFTEIVSVTPEICFYNKFIMIGEEAHAFSAKDQDDKNYRYFNIFQLITSTRDTAFNDLIIEGVGYTLCTHEIIAVFLHTLLNSVQIGTMNRVRIAKIVFTIPFTATSTVKERIRASARIAGFSDVRILSTLLTSAISALNAKSNYKDKDGRRLGPFPSPSSPKYMFVLDIHSSSFSIAIVQISPTSMTVKNPYGTDNLTEFLDPNFVHWHGSLYEGQNITPPSKDHVRRIYEKAISYVSKDVRDFTLNSIVTNDIKYPLIEEMVLHILQRKFSVLNESVVGHPLVGASLLASSTANKGIGVINELPSNMQVHDSSRCDLGLATGIRGEKKKRFDFKGSEFLTEEDDCIIRQVYSIPLPFSNSQPVKFYVLLDELYGESVFKVCKYQLVFTFGSKHFEKKLRDYVLGKEFKLEIEGLVDADGVYSLKASCLANSPVEFEMHRLDNVCSCHNQTSSPSSDFRKVVEICSRANANSVRK